jgi:hypothetical protein
LLVQSRVFPSLGCVQRVRSPRFDPLWVNAEESQVNPFFLLSEMDESAESRVCSMLNIRIPESQNPLGLLV